MVVLNTLSLCIDPV